MTIRVLQVCPFDIPDEPSAGGQIRIEAIAQAYRAAGCIVDRSCVVTRKRDARRPLDIVMPWLDRVRRKHLGKPSNLGQIRQHWAALTSQRLQSQLGARLTHSYQLIHIEHPWDVALMASLTQHPLLANAQTVYSAHNIEHELFESIAREQGNWNIAAQNLAQEIRKIEQDAAKHTDFTWAVSDSDAQQLRPFARQCIVAPNGCRSLPDHPHPTQFDKIRGRYALFIGANYAPNVNGFLNILGEDFSFLPTGTSIQTIGTCIESLQNHEPHRHWLQTGQLRHNGKVTEQELDSALLNAGVILLPITSGGGTNLKTAEALASGRQVLGTSKAFRGFDDWKNGQGVHLADSPEIFRDSLAKILCMASCSSPTTKRLGLNWSTALQPAIEMTLGRLY